MREPWLKVAQVAAELQVSVKTVRRHIRPSSQVGGQYRYLMSDVRSKPVNHQRKENTMSTQLRRQGDILLIPVATIPEDLAEVPRVHGQIVLAEGEATGHLHAIESPEATFLASDLAEIEGRFLAVEAEVDLVHPEHSTVTLPPGNYEVRRQREYADAGGVSYVAD